MPYTANIPQATDRMADSQLPILNNFIAIDTVVSVDHVTFDDATGGQGKHDRATFPRRTVAPIDPVTGATEVTLFSKVSTLGALETELFFARENAGSIVEFTSLGASPSGWSYLPSGLLMKWDVTAAAVSGQTNIVFSVGATIPAFTAIYNIVPFVFSPAAGDVDSAVRLTAMGPLDFDVYVSNRTTTGAAATATKIRFIALGK